MKPQHNNHNFILTIINIHIGHHIHTSTHPAANMYICTSISIITELCRAKMLLRASFSNSLHQLVRVHNIYFWPFVLNLIASLPLLRFTRFFFSPQFILLYTQAPNNVRVHTKNRLWNGKTLTCGRSLFFVQEKLHDSFTRAPTRAHLYRFDA